VQLLDTAAIEEERWAAFARALADHLAAQWPAMPERLGERYASFVGLALERAVDKGFVSAAAAARYVNLCFVWGPAFEDRAGFEWARSLMAGGGERAVIAGGGARSRWAATHRLLQRSLAELAQLPESRIEPATLEAADARLLEAFGHLGEKGALHPDEPPPLPRRACDLEAFELRLLELAASERYESVGGQWQRVPLAAPPPLRVNAEHPVPPIVGLLARASGVRPAAVLQLRARTHAVCDVDRHPALAFTGSQGRYTWQGHETRAVSWPVATLAQPQAAGGPGTAVAEETSPDIHKLELDVCGLRDEGEAFGAQRTLVWAWPAEQWWCEIQRVAPGPQSVDPARAPQAWQSGSTRCRVECDGRVQDAAALTRGFAALDAAVAGALRAWHAAWTRVEGLSAPQLDGVLALLVGQAGLTWGWQASSLAGRALMRVLAALKMQAALADLRCEGELALGGARSRITLACVQAAPLEFSLQREQGAAEAPDLVEALAPARVDFRLPVVADVVPLGSDSGAVLSATGPGTGALAGSAGLRPRSTGGSGFEWFASLRLEPVELPLELHDPLLGVQARRLALLPALALLDWRLG
jgi:hypothetical protein